MPLLAAFIGTLAQGFVALFGTVMGFGLALKFASYATWLVVFGTFLSTVYVCTSMLYQSLTGIFAGGGVNGGLVSALGMGVTMLIPSNAGGVLACVGSVWIATNIYKLQKQGIFNFSK